MSENKHGPEWRAEEVGRLYDKNNAVRESLITATREVKDPNNVKELQQITDAYYAIINANSDRIEFLIEHGEAWFDREHDGGQAAQLREKLWRNLEQSGKLVDEREQKHAHQPLPELQQQLERLHVEFARTLEALENMMKS